MSSLVWWLQLLILIAFVAFFGGDGRWSTGLGYQKNDVKSCHGW